MNWLQKLEIGIEELILLSLITIEALDFFTIIPAPIEYAEKVIAIIAMCYLFYHASITKIVFGVREKNYDLMIVSAYLLFSLKTAIGFVISSSHDISVMTNFYSIIIQNADIIEKTGFWVGGLTLLMIAGFLVREKVKKPSIMSIIHEKKKATGTWKKAIRFLSIYLVLVSILVVLFSFAIEWLTMTADAPLMMIILLFYLYVIVKRGRGMKTETFLKKVSRSSEEFYERFISSFHSRKTIMLAITGLLALHLLVEIGTFVIPYTTGLMYPKYFPLLGPGHEPLATHMAADFELAGALGIQIGTLLVYLLNVLAVLMLFFGPAYLWTHHYQKKTQKDKTPIPNIGWLFFGCLAASIIAPVFRLGQAKSSTLIGADITTQQIPLVGNVWQILVISVLVGCIIYLLSKKNPLRTTKLAFWAVMIYFGIYLYHFFINVAKYHVMAIVVMARSGQYFIAAHIFLFFTITIMFYVCGYIIFIWQTKDLNKNKS